MRFDQTLGPAAPLTLPTVASSWITATGDVDGDGRQEIAVFDGAIPAMGVLAGFQYADISQTLAGQGYPQIINADLMQPVSGSSHGPSLLIADVDGDGLPEVISVDLISFQLSVAKWKPQDSSDVTEGAGLETIWQATKIETGDGSRSWTPSTFQQYWTGDIDNDGIPELLSFDKSVGICVLQWEATAFVVDEIQGTPIPQASGGNLPWPLTSDQQFSCARLEAGSGDFVVVFDPLSIEGTRIAVLKWVGNTELQCQWVGATLNGPGGSWPLTPKQRFYNLDLDGDGLDEIFVFDPIKLQSAVLKWTTLADGALEVMGQGSFGTCDYSQQFWPCRVRSAEKEELFTLCASNNSVAIVGWTGSGYGPTLSAPYVNEIPAYPRGDGSTWPITASQQFQFADLDGDGCQEVVAFDAAGPSLGYLHWESYELMCLSKSMLRVPAWGLDLIGIAPPWSFVQHPFTGNQLAVYQWISNQLDAEARGDIRAQYIVEHREDWDALAVWLRSLAKPDNFEQSDWDTVKGALLGEMQAIMPVKALIQDLSQLLMRVRDQQLTDLQTNIGILPKDFADQDAYLLGLFAMIVTAVAAVPVGGPAFPIAMKLVSSALSTAAKNETAQTIPYPDIETTVKSTFNASTDQNESYMHTFLTDAVRLPLLGRLIKHGAWSFHMYEAEQAIDDLSNSNRIGFYQMQLPAGFAILSYVSATDTPDYPENSYWVVPVSGAVDPYVAYVLCQNTQGYPVAPSNLLIDLFATLQIYKPDLFYSKNGWDGIPQVVVSRDAAPQERALAGV